MNGVRYYLKFLNILGYVSSLVVRIFDTSWDIDHKIYEIFK